MCICILFQNEIRNSFDTKQYSEMTKYKTVIFDDNINTIELRKNNTGTNNEEDSSVCWFFSFLIGIIIYITIYMYDSDDERICF